MKKSICQMEKEEIKFTLSPNNLKDLLFEKYEQDFTFIVNGQEYKTSRIVADILSPKIKNAHLSDSTINKFYINTNNQKSDIIHFPDFLKLVNYETNSIKTDIINEYSDYFYHLGNNHDYIRLQLIRLNLITKEDPLLTFSSIFLNEEKQEISYEEEGLKDFISFISSHFYEIDQEKMKKLPKSAIYSIISNPNLRVSDEDSFLNFIVELYLNDRSYSDLFEYVIFNNVRKKALKSFFSVFTYEDINMNIWHSICDLFTSQSNSNHSERYNINEKHLFHISEFKNDKFSGIMRYLNNNKKGNIHDNGTIKIASNSICADCLHPKNLVDFDK